jgi:hypothetical protein
VLLENRVRGGLPSPTNDPTNNHIDWIKTGL